MSFATKIRPYAVISLDLSSARTKTAQGTITLRGEAKSTWKANTLTVLTLGGGSLDFRLNDSDDDAITAEEDMKQEGPPFGEIYWTNTAQAGITAKIFLAWVD